MCGLDMTDRRRGAKFCSDKCRNNHNNETAFLSNKNKPLNTTTFNTKIEKNQDTVSLLREIRDALKLQSERFLTPEQVCSDKYLSISKRTYLRYVAEGIIKQYHMKGSGRVYVRLSDINSAMVLKK